MSEERKSGPIELKLIDPPYNSQVVDLVIELDYLRKKPLSGTTYPSVFFQLKHIFHTLESIGSARIEGNRTTVAEFIETKIIEPKNKDEEIIEIQNGEKALEYIDEYFKSGSAEINRAFLSNLHKIVVKDLTPPPNGEGRNYPGEYRRGAVKVTGSNFVPMDYTQVGGFMDELLGFINDDSAQKYDLLKTAIVHHRFAWIHPFDNGNGRTVRLLTYAMLVKQGFNIDMGGRIINPTAVFCNDRNEYYEKLSVADTGIDKDVMQWCEYVLGGLKLEIEKIDKLLDYDYLSETILSPSIEYALGRKLITANESKVLKVAIEKQVFQASDVKRVLPDKIPAEISRLIRGLKDKKMIDCDAGQQRKYVLCFTRNYLVRGIIEALGENGFLPVNDES